jgi:hypothetical protein
VIHDICWKGARPKLTGLLTCAVLINLAACGAVSPLQDQEPKPDLSRLRQAAADLEGSVAVGVSYLDFRHKLQNVSSALVWARQTGVKPDRLRPYEQAIEGYMDSLNLWKLKLQCPSAFGDGYPECSATLEVEALAAKYGLPFDRHAPLGPELGVGKLAIFPWASPDSPAPPSRPPGPSPSAPAIAALRPPKPRA